MSLAGGWEVGGVGQAGVNGLSVQARTDEISSLKNSSLAELHTVVELGGGADHICPLCGSSVCVYMDWVICLDTGML